jgi:hypothetical protein
MTQTIKQFTDFDDAIWFVERERAYLEEDGDFRVEIVWVNNRWRVTVEAEEITL